MMPNCRRSARIWATTDGKTDDESGRRPAVRALCGAGQHRRNIRPDGHHARGKIVNDHSTTVLVRSLAVDVRRNLALSPRHAQGLIEPVILATPGPHRSPRTGSVANRENHDRVQAANGGKIPVSIQNMEQIAPTAGATPVSEGAIHLGAGQSSGLPFGLKRAETREFRCQRHKNKNRTYERSCQGG